MTKLQAALHFAVKRHKGQDREGDSPLPYVTHPIEVLVNVRQIGGVTDEDLLAAAVLHDTLEETDATFDDLASRFGSRAAGLVKELTRTEPNATELRGLSKSQIWKLRSELLLNEIRLMGADAQSIKLADRLSNLREGRRVRNSKSLARYLGQTQEILEAIPESVNPNLWQALSTELDEAQMELKRQTS